jgi:uncharacterized tellurite resistance protein B-like protein
MRLEKSDAKILLRCMVAMALADEKLHAEEITVISAAFEKLTGQPVDGPLLGDLLEIGRNKPLSISDDDSLASTCSLELRRLIVKACYLVTIADRAIVEREIDMMATIAAGLGVSQAEFSHLIRELNST